MDDAATSRQSDAAIEARPGRPRLTAAQKLAVVPAIARIVLAGVCAFMTGPWRGQEGAPTYLQHIGYAVLRASTSYLTDAQVRWILPGTDQSYLNYCKQTKTRPQSIALAHGARGHWVGDRDADNVLVWYHGGGFCLPAMDSHFHFLEQLVTAAAAANKSLAVLALSYTLVPDGRHPMQLRQAVEALRHVVSAPGRPGRRRFLVGGDSAGASLVLGVVSHLAHPHPLVAELRLPAREPLAGAVCLGPWGGNSKASPPSLRHGPGDLITPAIEAWVTAYRCSDDADFYTDSVNAPSSWFEALPVACFLFCIGGNEILRPMCEEYVQHFRTGFPGDVELFVGHREAHVAPVYNMQFGSKAKTLQGRKIEQWLVEALSS